MPGNSATSTDVKVLTKTRQYVRQRIKKLFNKTIQDADSGVEMTEQQRSLAKSKIEDLKIEVQKLDKDLMAAMITGGAGDSELDQFSEGCDEYSEMIFQVLSLLHKPPAAVSTESSDSPHYLKLPNCPLPVFSNDDDELLESFFYNFESIIRKHRLNTFEKFIMLKGQLRKGPLRLIESVAVNDRNYETAKDVLTQAFASTVTQQYKTISNLSKLKLKIDDDPYTFIGQIRTITNSFQSLKITTDNVLAYFIWNSMNDRFQNHIIQICNSNKPSLDQINKSLYEATERYNRQTDNLKKYNKDLFKSNNTERPKVNSHSLAVNVETKGTYNICNLCKSDNNTAFQHFMRDCPVYDSPSKKITKLKQINACTKCSFKSHNTRECRFKFKSPCVHCKQFHMSFLCGKYSNDNGTTNANCSTVSISYTGNLPDKSIMLHTMTCDIIGRKNNGTVRLLKDSGCQRNFITEDAAKFYDFPIIKSNVLINVRGFHAKRTIKTNIVKVSLVINNTVECIEAFCVNSIDIAINIPMLGEIVNKFRANGYTLADKFLLHNNRSNEVSNISLVLGTEVDYLLPVKSVVFGTSDKKSSFIETPLGVIPTGCMDTMIVNLNDLPNNSSNDVNYFNSIITSNCNEYSLDTGETSFSQ